MVCFLAAGSEALQTRRRPSVCLDSRSVAVSHRPAHAENVRSGRADRPSPASQYPTLSEPGRSRPGAARLLLASRGDLDAARNPRSASPPLARAPAHAPERPGSIPGSEPARSEPGRAPVQTRAAGIAARSHRGAARTRAERSPSARARSPRRAHVPRRRYTSPTRTAHPGPGRCNRGLPGSSTSAPRRGRSPALAAQSGRRGQRAVHGWSLHRKDQRTRSSSDGRGGRPRASVQALQGISKRGVRALGEEREARERGAGRLCVSRCRARARSTRGGRSRRPGPRR